MSAPEIYKKFTLIDAINLLIKSWDEVKSTKITRCFKSCGTEVEENHHVEEQTDSTVLPPEYETLSMEIFGCKFKELVELEKNYEHSNELIDWNIPTTEILNQLQNEE